MACCAGEAAAPVEAVARVAEAAVRLLTAWAGVVAGQAGARHAGVRAQVKLRGGAACSTAHELRPLSTSPQETWLDSNQSRLS